MKGCSNRRQFNEPFQRNPSQSIAIHRNPCNPCNPHRNPHRNPSQSIAIHCVPSQSIAIHRNASVRDTTSYSYLSVSGRKKFLNYLISEGHRGGCWLCVAGVNYRPHGVRRVPLRLAGVGSTTSLPPQRGPSEISLRRSNYFQTPPPFVRRRIGGCGVKLQRLKGKGDNPSPRAAVTYSDTQCEHTLPNTTRQRRPERQSPRRRSIT